MLCLMSENIDGPYAQYHGLQNVNPEYVIIVSFARRLLFPLVFPPCSCVDPGKYNSTGSAKDVRLGVDVPDERSLLVRPE